VKPLSAERARRRLGGLWLASALPLFLLLFVQGITGRYGEHLDKAWAWALPTVLPTCSLIVGVWFADRKRPRSEEPVGRFRFRVALGLSGFYLLLVWSTLLLQPFSRFPVLEMFRLSHLWLAPAQGLAAAALAAFFRE
jgi:hypothetical protein